MLDISQEEHPEDTEREQRCRAELAEFLKERRPSMELQPLVYWKANCHRYPLLALVVRKYFTTPPGSAAVERLFSGAKNVFGLNRHKLKPENMERDLFLKSNLRFSGYLLNYPSPSGCFVAPNNSAVPKASVSADSSCYSDGEGTAEDNIMIRLDGSDS